MSSHSFNIYLLSKVSVKEMTDTWIVFNDIISALMYQIVYQSYLYFSDTNIAVCTLLTR